MKTPFGKFGTTNVDSEIVNIKEKNFRPIIAVTRLDHFGDLELPQYETPQSAGMDLRAALKEGRG